MNDEPIFTKCGRELYEKKCVFWVTVLTSQKKHPVVSPSVKCQQVWPSVTKCHQFTWEKAWQECFKSDKGDKGDKCDKCDTFQPDLQNLNLGMG